MPLTLGICEGGLVAMLCGSWKGFQVRAATRKRREYEECVKFLRDTPLFKLQLPKADIPLLAAEFRRRSFRPGAVLAKQGEILEEFFLVVEGEASVLVNGEECATMSKGDFWGDCSRKSPSVATVQVCGNEALVAFSMSRAQFQQLGLDKQLRLPKRHAIRDGRGLMRDCMAMERAVTMTADDEELVVQALMRDAKLQEFHCERYDVARAVARKAAVRYVKAGNVIVSSGDFSREFYIVRSGEVEVIPPLSRPRCNKSTEALLNLERMRDECSDVVMHHGSYDFSRSNGAPLGQPSCDDLLPQRRKKSRARTKMAQPMVRLHRGNLFGEEVMLYNAQHAATFRAADGEDVELYVVARQDYLQHVHHGSELYDEWCRLLDEADALSVLFQNQRRELARRAQGYQRFDRGAMVVKQGRQAESPLLYVVAAGSGKVLVPLPAERPGAVQEIPLRRGNTFCETAAGAGYAVQAGDLKNPFLTCLCIDLALLVGTPVSEEDLSPAFPHEPSPAGRGSTRRRTSLALATGGPFNPRCLEPVCVLGVGGFGFVTLQRDRRTQQLHAVKRISKGIIPTSFYENICAERDLMEMADSRFIIGFISSYRDSNFLYMVMEPALGGDLLHVRHRHREVFDRDANGTVMFYVGCVLAGLEHLHERHIIYRDLKPENALLDARGYAKLCDMGMARFVCGKTYTFCGTPEYMAPEVLKCSGHDCAADWWSLGVLTCDLLAGVTPWTVENDGAGAWVKALLARQKQGFAAHMLPEHAQSGPTLAFVRELLALQPSKRLGGGGRGAREIRAHSWFQVPGFNFQALHQMDDSVLPPPVRPAAFRPPQLPVPDIHAEVPLMPREGRVINGARVVQQERMVLQAAVARLQCDDKCDGLYARMPASEDEPVFVFFVQSRSSHSPWFDERPEWVAYMKSRSLFRPYEEDAERLKWDASFELPPELVVGGAPDRKSAPLSARPLRAGAH